MQNSFNRSNEIDFVVQYDQCLQDRLEQFSKEQTEMNAIFNHEPIQYGEIVSLPFTGYIEPLIHLYPHRFSLGNGYLGLSLSSQSHIQFLPDIRSPFISSGYSPVIQISSDTWQVSSASVVQIKQGLVRRIQCFQFNPERPASVTHTLYAHRKRPSLIIQEIDILNPSENALDLNFQRKKQSLEHDYKQLEEEDVQFDTSKEIYQMTTSQISTRPHHVILFVTIQNKLLSDSHVKAGR